MRILFPCNAVVRHRMELAVAKARPPVFDVPAPVARNTNETGSYLPKELVEALASANENARKAFGALD